MADSILADPMRQNDELIGTNYTRVTLPAATWTRICPTNPRRQALVVQAITSVADLYIMPTNLGVVGGVAPVGPTGLVVRHSAEYLALTAGIWWGYSQGGQDVLVWDLSRT